jgi:hypothetical protein
MLPYIIGGTLATLIGSNVVHALAEGIIYTICSSASFLRRGTESNKMINAIRLRIEEMDIPIKLKLVQKLLKTLPKTETNSILEEGLVEIIFNIQSNLASIEYEINKHNDKWFSGYRNIAVDDKLRELERLIRVLDGRIGLLMVGRTANN